MTTFSFYDNLGTGVDMSAVPDSEPFSYNLQVGNLTWASGWASGSVTGTHPFGITGIDSVQISYTPVVGSTDLQVTEVTFGAGKFAYPPHYAIKDLNLIVTKATLDSGDLSWLTVSLAGNDSLRGTNKLGLGHDYIKGGQGNDTIEDSGGNDRIFGGAGDDRMNVWTGNDTLDGGSGNDMAFFIGRPDDYSFSLRKDGAVIVTDRDGVMGKDVLLNVEVFEFENGGSFTQKDLFIPEKVHAGNETIMGSNSNDVLKGYGGSDTLHGLIGNDYLFGGIGNDRLYGWTGRDQFVFDMKPSSTNIDRIYDFDVENDTIRLENAIFTKIGVSGTLKAGAFWTNNTGRAHDRDDRVIYDKNSGVLYYDPDGTGSAKAVAFTNIQKNLSMSHKDIYVI